MSSKQPVLWRKDPTFERWMGTITRKSTQRSYRCWFKNYVEFTEQTPSELIDEALEDLKRDPQEKQDIVLRRLIDFYNFMKTDYQKKPKGKDKTKYAGKGVSDKVAHARVGAVRSFYGTFGITVRMKGRQSLPRLRVTNKRMRVNAEQVKILFNHTRNLRDRAIILTLFQGGMDVSTLCSLKYGDIQEGLTKNEHPLKLDLYRPKTGVEYFTFLGMDAVKAIRAYIIDRESRGTEFNYGNPLFLKEKHKPQAVTTNLIQNMMKTVAQNAGFIDAKNNGTAFNLLGPHALRESFGSIMIKSGVPDTIVDFWLGHAIGEMGKAYKSVQFDSLKKMYLEREKLLTVSGSQMDGTEIDEKINKKVQDETNNLSTLVNILSSKNVNLETDMKELASENQNTKNRLEELEKKDRETKEKMKSLEKTLAKTLEAINKKLNKEN